MSDSVQVVVLASKTHYWLLRGLFYTFRMHWPNQPIIVAGYETPDSSLLPNGARFVSIAPNNYPVQLWSNGFIKFLNGVTFDYFILMLEDYWLIEPVKTDMVRLLYNYMIENGKKDKILKIDLTHERAVRRQCRPYDWIDEGDTKISIIESPPQTSFQMNFQASLWNKELLLKVLRLKETPQEAEVNGTKRLRNQYDFTVLGTLQRPVVYQPVYRANRRKFHKLNRIPRGQLKRMTEEGCLLR